MPQPSVGQSKEEFRNWVSIDDDVETVQEQTEEEFTEELVSMILNNDKHAISSDDDYDKPDKETPSAAKMRKCLHCLSLGLERTTFHKMDMFYAMKAEVDDHFYKKFSPKQTFLHTFFCVK